jgi:hypothetical protein
MTTKPVKKFPALMELEGACVQESATGPYFEQDESVPLPHTLLLLSIF